MKKIKSKLATTLLTVLVSGTTARAVLRGPSTSGGGVAVVCRNASGQIQKSILLDLYEAENRYHLRLPQATGSLTRDYALAAANTYRLQGSPGLTNEELVERNLRNFFEIARMTSQGQKLPTLNDVGSYPELPHGCQLEQLAVFHDAPKEYVDIDSEIWNSMDSLNQAALVEHEIAYQWERTLNDRTSENTRAMVAHVYAIAGAVPENEGVPFDALRCWSSDPSFDEITVKPDGGRSATNMRGSAFAVFPIMTAEGMGVRLQLSALAGRPAIVKTTIEIPGIKFKVRREHRERLLGFDYIVEEPNVNVDREIKVQDGILRGMSIRVIYKTNEPVRLIVKDRFGQVQTEEFISACSQN